MTEKLDRLIQMIDTGVHITDVVLFNSLKAEIEQELDGATDVIETISNGYQTQKEERRSL